MLLLQQPESPVYKGRIYSLQTSALSFGLSKGWHVLLSWLTLTSWDSEDYFFWGKKMQTPSKKQQPPKNPAPADDEILHHPFPDQNTMKFLRSSISYYYPGHFLN